MGQVADRLAQLGFVLPDVVPPLAAYVPAVRSGNLVFTAGQLPMRNGQLMGHGLVPTDVSVQDAASMAAQCALNAIAAVASVVEDLDRVQRVVKVVGYVACDPAFAGHPQVVNGASELLAAAFGQAGQHARSAVGVSSLPLGAPVELEMIVEID